MLSFRFFSFDTGASTHAREDCVLECAIAVLRSLPSFLCSRCSSYIPLVRVQRKGKRKETEKNQTLSTVIDIHVCRKTITEACVVSDDGCVCTSLFV